MRSGVGCSWKLRQNIADSRRGTWINKTCAGSNARAEGVGSGGARCGFSITKTIEVDITGTEARAYKSEIEAKIERRVRNIAVNIASVRSNGAIAIVGAIQECLLDGIRRTGWNNANIVVGRRL